MRHPKRTFIGGGVIIFALIVLAIPTYVFALKLSETTVTFTVIDKDSITISDIDGNVQNEYRVYTDKGTFKVTDTLVYGRFNSADVYGRLKREHTYECRVAGWRIPFFSKFQNIISCKEATS